MDPLFARAQLAIEEGERLRAERRDLKNEYDEQALGIRRAIHESASARRERKAIRDKQG